MKLFVTSWADESGEHHGYSYGCTKKESIANRPYGSLCEEDDQPRTEEHEITITKQGLIQALNRFGSHNDNG